MIKKVRKNWNFVTDCKYFVVRNFAYLKYFVPGNSKKVFSCSKFSLAFTNSIINLFLKTGQTITKSDLIACLSEIARNDVINDKKPRTLSAQCRGQLKFQLLQKHTNINLNPRVVSSNWGTVELGNKELFGCPKIVR